MGIFPHSPDVPGSLSDLIPSSEGRVPGDSRVYEAIAPGATGQNPKPVRCQAGGLIWQRRDSGAAAAASFPLVELVPVWTDCPQFASSPSMLNGLLGKAGEEELPSGGLFSHMTQTCRR